MAGGFACAGAGHLIEKAGFKLQQMGSERTGKVATVLQRVGEEFETGGQDIFQIGKYTSYTVLVPTYIAAYALPKWTITIGIPKTLDWIDRVACKVCVVTRKILRSLFTFLVQKPLIFLVKRVSKTIHWIAKMTVKTVQKTIAGLNWITTHCLIPVIKWTLTELILPVADAARTTMNVVHFVAVRTLTAMVSALSVTTRLIQRAVITPIYRAITTLVVKTLQLVGAVSRSIYVTGCFVGKAARDSIKFICQSIFRSIARAVNRLALGTLQLVSGVAKGANFVGTIVGKVVLDIHHGFTRWPAMVLRPS